MAATPRIGILGGGFAGLETAFYLRHKLGSRAHLTLISDNDHFYFKPNTIYIPFGEDPERFRIPLSKPAARKQIELVRGKVESVDLDTKQVNWAGGNARFDHIVIATGATMREAEIPGLREHAVTIWTVPQMLLLRQRLAQLIEQARSGRAQRLLFLVPPNNRCSGPLYELVMMADTHLRRAGVRDRVTVTWTTYESGYIQAFGPRLNTVVQDEFSERDIAGHKGFVVTGIEPGVVQYQNGERMAFDLLVSFPPYVAAQQFAGLPADDRGFLRVDPETRRLNGQENVFAAGDAADFPIKQAFLALLQADAVGEQLTAGILGRMPEFTFEPISMCVMEELNRATFAQVPLKYTGDPMKPVAVDEDDQEHYLVGVSPIWRLGKKVLGIYLPWRFAHGQPFHAGFGWNMMDLGLKVMSKLFAR